MVTGTRAFHASSPIETMNAIVKEEPPELTEVSKAASPLLAPESSGAVSRRTRNTDFAPPKIWHSLWKHPQ